MSQDREQWMTILKQAPPRTVMPEEGQGGGSLIKNVVKPPKRKTRHTVK